jgi:hypothetical protein
MMGRRFYSPRGRSSNREDDLPLNRYEFVCIYGGETWYTEEIRG